ncbi:MAG: glycogen/starch synthase [Candidatus Woesearchaeota archaeon]
MVDAKADFLFEVSWEVCNKVGGIHTVINTKCSEITGYYKKYILIGPYFEHSAKVEFIQLEPSPEIKKIFEELKNYGIICYYGRWLENKSRPETILIDANGFMYKKNEIKGKFWEYYGIDSIRAGWDFEEPSIWSYAAGMLIERMQNICNGKIVAHFHEWLSGFGLLYLKKYCSSIATVFTTHATILGRTLSSKGVNIYDNIDSIDVTFEIYRNNIEAKHLTEKASALNSDVFTTVSEITAIESEKFLGRKPEFLLINGLDLEKFPSFEEISIKHITSRDKIREFLTYYFFPYYVFDINNNLVAYTIGRYEYRNKGYDIIIKALGLLNDRLKRGVSNKTLSMIFWVPMQHYGVRLDVLENKNYYMHIKNHILSNGPDILKRIIYDFISKKDDINNLFTESFINDLKREIVTFSRKGTPPFSTHNINDNELIVSDLKNNGLLNRKEDCVKVIIEPVYLDGMDGFIDLSHYDVMVGCHLGLFPSCYEPWGYTPLESASLGVPSVTTDLSGFGRFIKNKNPENKGIMVLDRHGRSYDESANSLAEMLWNFVNMSHSERINCKLTAKNLSKYADWNKLIENYILAHNYALEKRH